LAYRHIALRKASRQRRYWWGRYKKLIFAKTEDARGREIIFSGMFFK
jgi:hypothetical protein